MHGDIHAGREERGFEGAERRWSKPSTSASSTPDRNNRTLRSDEASPALVMRSDNQLVFGAKSFVAVARRYGVGQKCIMPYTPEQNSMSERYR